MTITIFQDTVCPWCRLGKAYLNQALAELPEPGAVVVQLRAYLLNAAIPPQGVDYQAYMRSVIRDPARLVGAFAHLSQLGQAAGVPFHFERIRFMPDSRLSHRVIAAAPPTHQSALTDRITHAYFAEGQDIGSLDVLVGLGQELGLEPAALRAAAYAPATEHAVLADMRQAATLGIGGVPAAVVGEHLVQGAQSPAAWLTLLQAVR